MPVKTGCKIFVAIGYCGCVGGSEGYGSIADYEAVMVVFAVWWPGKVRRLARGESKWQ